MNRQYEQVKEFHKGAKVAMPDKPTVLDFGVKHVFGNYYTEGLQDFCDDLRKDKDGVEVYFRTSLLLEELIEFLQADTIEDQADALGDLIYLAIGTFTSMGLKPEGIFNRIHAANMRKRWPDGTFHFNEVGKIVKPPNWYGPEDEIKEEIQKQLKGE